MPKPKTKIAFRKFYAIILLTMLWVPVFIGYGAVSAIAITNRAIAEGKDLAPPYDFYYALFLAVCAFFGLIYGARALWRSATPPASSPSNA